MWKSYLIFILLIGLHYTNADGDDTTEAISDSTEFITEMKESEIGDTVKSDDAEDEMKMQNPTVKRLPADSETIRKNIIDSQFSCDDKEPGYYADIENECQIFHRCLEGRSEIYSFICPEQTIFHQKNLVCVWEDHFDFDCSESESYYKESNRAFFGNATAEENMQENVKNSQEIKTSAEVMTSESPVKEEIKLFEISPSDDLSITQEDESKMVEKNSLEDQAESVSVSEETEESNDYEAELIPSSTNHIDASIATSSSSNSASHPQKISISVLDPIIEIKSDDQTQEPITTRNIRKRSGNHRRRFLFKADAKH